MEEIWLESYNNSSPITVNLTPNFADYGSRFTFQLWGSFRADVYTWDMFVDELEIEFEN